MAKIRINKLSVLCLGLAGLLTGCSSIQGGFKSIGSDFSGGITRDITLYDGFGRVIRKWHGKIFVEASDGEALCFLLNGKRYQVTGTVLVEEEE